MTEKYELVILGQGSAAFAGAIKADDLGIRTALIGANETSGALLGGTCVNVGCTPTKTMVASARVAYLARRAAEYGVR